MAQRQTLPVLPLRGTVIFPGLTAPIDYREPAGSHPRCVSPFGVRDMSGNRTLVVFGAGDEVVVQAGEQSGLVRRSKSSMENDALSPTLSPRGEGDKRLSLPV